MELNDIQFGLVRRIKEEYREKDKKLYMFFVHLEKAFDRVPKRVLQWTLRKKGLPQILVKAMMSLHKGSKTKLKVGSVFSEKFSVVVDVHWKSVLYPFCLQLWWML